MKTLEQITSEKLKTFAAIQGETLGEMDPMKIGELVKRGVEYSKRIDERRKQDPAITLVIEFFAFQTEQAFLATKHTNASPSGVLRGNMLWMVIVWEDIMREFDDQLKVDESQKP